jgi:hypothetical protein
VGYDKEGLPIGLQIIGRPWAEATILRVASAVEVRVYSCIHINSVDTQKSKPPCSLCNIQTICLYILYYKSLIYVV